MGFQPIFFVAALIATVVRADLDPSTRGTNAANVVQAGIEVCNDAQTGKDFNNNNVPYIVPQGKLIAGMGVIGGVLKFFHNQQMDRQFKNAMASMNNQFNELETNMNNRFNEMEGLIDRKQFESDITDPSTIMWGQMQAYAMYPSNETYANAMFDCGRQVAWQIATKIHNRLFGPDNTIMTQVRADQYKNSTFMAVKDVIMFRMFQTMMVQAFCLGVQHGPNYAVANDWQMLRMNTIYSDIVSNAVQMRKQQMTDYFLASVPDIVAAIVQTKATGSEREKYTGDIYNTLNSYYHWDHFGVVVADFHCDQIAIYPTEYNTTGGLPWSMYYSYWRSPPLPLDVYVIRYWDNGPGDLKSYMAKVMENNHHGNINDWAKAIVTNSNLQFALLRSSWYCGGNTDFWGDAPSAAFANGATYKEGEADGVIAPSKNSINITYDLGFWERDITIDLLPYQ